MSSRLSSETIKAEARSLGFSACGVAEAGQVDKTHADAFIRWIKAGGHAGMDYMAHNTDKRLDPTLLMPGVKSIVCVALNYSPAQRLPAGEPQIAAYALGRDYHDIMKSKLHTLAANLGISTYRAFCDTAPVMERYWAEQAGIGWTGRNRQLIIPHAGSMFFLGELFLDICLDYDKPIQQRCGTCRACTQACPTGALGYDGTFDAGMCLSYLTIENRGTIPRPAAEKMGNCIYGCDRCQDACPWNRFAKPTEELLLAPKPELISMTRADWQQLTVEQYRTLFKGSAVKRAKYEGLTRNISAATRNQANGQDADEAQLKKQEK